jgi:hypothetical protein
MICYDFVFVHIVCPLREKLLSFGFFVLYLFLSSHSYLSVYLSLVFIASMLIFSIKKTGKKSFFIVLSFVCLFVCLLSILFIDSVAVSV